MDNSPNPRDDLAMAATLKTIEATIDADGIVDLAEPLKGPARAVITLLIDDLEPNAITVASIEESWESLPRHSSIKALLEELNA